MTCSELEELAGAYVLDAVTPEEREEVERHLAECPGCTKLVKELRSTVDMLPLSVPQVSPSPELKERILSAIQTAAVASSQSTQHVGAVRPMEAMPPPVQLRRPASIPARRRSAAQRWAMPLVAAAVILLLLSGGLTAWNISLQHGVSSLQAEVTNLRANELTTKTYAIKGSNVAPDATGQVVYIPNLNITVIEVHGLPQLQGNQVYQGWLIQGKQTKSVGLLNVQDNGDATVNFAGDVTGYQAAAVSREPGPTATPNAPKGNVVAVGLL